MDLSGKNVLVVGLGTTGEAVCRFLLARGARVRLSEKKRESELGPRLAYWRERGVAVEAGGHRQASFLASDLVVPSPGVPPLPEIEAARARGIPVWSEVELAGRFLRGRTVGITGSNGKSTTATLVHRLLRDGGLKAFLAGNIGTPLISFVDRSRDDHVFVTEVSSFQLEHTETFRVAVAAFLNISQNHLDWHKTFESYYAAKKKLLARLGGDGWAILNREDPLVWRLRAEGDYGYLAFSLRRPVARGAFLRDGWLVVRERGEEMRLLKVADVRLPGAHNLDNVMAAVLVGRLFGLAPGRMRTTVRSFRGLEHRLEDVLTVRGVRFVNDSKATTVDATLKAIASFDRPLVLILGGRDKGGDFTPLQRAVKGRVRGVVLVGEAMEKIEAALGGVVPVERADTYPAVVRRAAAAAKRGDVVLLAPAATSWDMFRNFEERGRVFKREVRRLARTGGGGRR